MYHRVKKTQTEEPDFTDKLYQEKLPMHARSTASKAVKNNLRITEIMADQNLILGAQKVIYFVEMFVLWDFLAKYHFYWGLQVNCLPWTITYIKITLHKGWRIFILIWLHFSLIYCFSLWCSQIWSDLLQNKMDRSVIMSKCVFFFLSINAWN